MQFIIFSDIQFYKNPQKSYTREDGMNSWLYEQVAIVKQVFAYAEENGVYDIIYGGDLFEEKNRIDVFVYNIVWDLFREYSGRFRFIFNTGNHDMHNIDRDSSLRPFSAVATVVTEPSLHQIGNGMLKIIPYGMTGDNLSLPKELFSKNNILVTHEDIAGLKLGPLDYKSGSPLKKEIFGDWTYVLNGHIHKPQTVGNIINVGSCMQQDFSEIDEEKRFVHYKDGDIISIPLDHPKFFSFDGLNDKLKKMIEIDDRNFYRIDIDSKLLSDSIFKKFNVFPNLVKSEKREIRLKEKLTDEEELEEYIKLFNKELDKEKLLKVGKELQR